METCEHTLSKTERLCGQKRISRLFEEGESGFVYPYRYVFLRDTSQREAALLISVSKRYHKRANKRNLLKRRTREAFRMNNSDLKSILTKESSGIDLALIYSTKEILNYNTIENAVRKILETIQEHL